MAKKTRQYEEARQRLDRELQSAQNDLRELERELEALNEDDPLDRGTPTNHMADMGSDIFERERMMSVEGELRTRMQMIEDARARLDDGTYGKCARCGREIAPERLEALPFALHCIDCAEELDRREGQQVGVKLEEPLTPDRGSAPGP